MDEVSNLIVKLNDRNPHVRFNAIEALRKRGDRRAVDPLIMILDDPKTSVFVAYTLRQIGSPKALNAVQLWRENVMQNPTPLTQALMSNLDFDQAELELNRQGQLSVQQRQHIRRHNGGELVLMGAGLGILVTVGGTLTPFIFAWNPIIGGLLTLVLVLGTGWGMVQMARFQMSPQDLQRWGKQVVITNMLLGCLAVISWMLVIYFSNLFQSSEVDQLPRIIVIMLVMLGFMPLIYIFRTGLRRKVRVTEGYAKLDIEGIGPRRDLWASKIGVLSNVGVFGLLIARNMLQGRGLGRHPEDFKFLATPSIRIGKRKFYMERYKGRSFMEGAYYRVYYAPGYPSAVVLSGEALPKNNLEA